jgi:predicted nuclease with RNAse H fold
VSSLAIPLWVGIDPGGSNAFGVAILFSDGKTMTHVVSCADEAVALIDFRPLGVGVDAPLWWSSGRSADRKADKWIRDVHKIHPGTVQTANSLRGAALVQGMMFVSRLRERLPDVRVTEVHPKAVAKALGGWECKAVAELYAFPTDNEHKRDAIMAAIAAREGFEGRWSRDLALERYASEQDPQRHWLGPVSYFWPL